MSVIKTPGMTAASTQALIDQSQTEVVYSMDATPVNGATITIPQSTARIVNLLLWPATDLDQITVMLPPTMLGRRVFLYTDKAIAQVTVATSQPGVVVRNGVASLNNFDQTVFNTANLAIWARVITS